jgi:hypothetical protein
VKGTNVAQLTLPEAVEALYQVFSRYPLAALVKGCPHCVFDEDNVLIHSAPLRVLTHEALEKYAWKALSTWGDSHDYRHFLPRLFELQAQSTLEPVEVEIAFGKLPYGGWHNWPEDEQEAIRQYYMALWRDVLGNRSVDDDLVNTEASSYLCAFVRSGEALEPYLSVWSEGDWKHKQDHFRAAVDRFSAFLRDEGRLAGAFWEPKPSAKLREWFAREETWVGFGLTRPW